MVLPHERRTPVLSITARTVHLGISLAWSAVMAAALPRRAERPEASPVRLPSQRSTSLSSAGRSSDPCASAGPPVGRPHRLRADRRTRASRTAVQLTHEQCHVQRRHARRMRSGSRPGGHACYSPEKARAWLGSALTSGTSPMQARPAGDQTRSLGGGSGSGSGEPPGAGRRSQERHCAPLCGLPPAAAGGLDAILRHGRSRSVGRGLPRPADGSRQAARRLLLPPSPIRLSPSQPEPLRGD